MWNFLSSLPHYLSITVIVLSIIAIVIISLRGHLKAVFGKKSVELGSDNSESFQVKPPPATVIIQKRNCVDCIIMLMAEREKFEFNIRQESERVLKTQMNFVEQKLIEIQNSFMGVVTDIANSFTIKNSNAIDKNIQYKLIYGLFKDALVSIKDEIRRSFKNNGFYSLSGSEFINYIKDQANVITSMLNQHINNIYPNKPGLIDVDELSGILKNQNNFLSTILDDIYIHAREIKLETDSNIKDIQQQFGRWIDEFKKSTIREDV